MSHRGLGKVLRRPRLDDTSSIRSSRRTGEQMIGVIERDEALRMLGGHKYRRGILDADHRITRRVHNQQRLTERANSIFQPVLLGVRDKTAPNAELAPRQRHLCLTL